MRFRICGRDALGGGDLGHCRLKFEQFGALTPDSALKGLIAGAPLMSGDFIAKRFVLRLEP